MLVIKLFALDGYLLWEEGSGLFFGIKLFPIKLISSEAFSRVRVCFESKCASRSMLFVVFATKASIMAKHNQPCPVRQNDIVSSISEKSGNNYFVWLLDLDLGLLCTATSRTVANILSKDLSNDQRFNCVNLQGVLGPGSGNFSFLFRLPTVS